MKKVYDGKSDSYIGRFNLEKSRLIASNRENNDSRWYNVRITANKKYIMEFVSCWQGEKNTYTAFSSEEAIEKMLEWEYSEEAIQKEFPDYKEKETY